VSAACAEAASARIATAVASFIVIPLAGLKACTTTDLFLIVVRVRTSRNRARAGVEVLLNVLAAPDDALRSVGGNRLVFLALRAQRVLQHVVALMALVG